MENQLRRDVEALAAPGSRKVGSQGHDLARRYLIKRMDEAGLQPYSGSGFELPYEVEDSSYINLAGILPGKNRALPPIQLVAHYDTCGDQPGADDNAAAIAIWFDVLNRIKAHSFQRDILFLFPDAEEPPRFLTEHMGSSNFYTDQRVGEIHAGLVLDLVGHDVPMAGMNDLLFIFGAESHSRMAELLLKSELPEGLRNIATLNRYVGDLSDHHILREKEKPYLFLTCGRWEHYHQESDLPDHLNYVKMERISTYVITLIKQLDQTEFELSGYNTDPISMELKLIQRALGPYLAQAGIPMSNRDELQRFVLGWVKQYQL